LARGRKTGGRKPGVPNKRTIARLEALNAASGELRAQLDAEAAQAPPDKLETAPVVRPPIVLPDAPVNWFRGDAHALLRTIYTDPRVPMELRVDAAKSAIRFERPALVASHVQHSNAPSKAVLAAMTTDQLKALLLEIDADPTPLIEGARSDDGE
jgi:hypothetical protein